MDNVKAKTCGECPRYRAFTLEEGLCSLTGAVCMAPTKACSRSGGGAPTGTEESMRDGIRRTEEAVAKARAEGHWKCVRDLEKKLEKQRKELREYERR